MAGRRLYLVKEIYRTLQGEGMQTGRLAVFCRFAGCNLWSGREADRARALCTFCDTDFRGTDGAGGGRYAGAAALAAAILERWPSGSGRPFVVFTGGEPLLQLDAALTEALHRAGAEIAVETNGTRLPPPGIDWLTVSPKAKAPLVIERGDELKLVYRQAEAPPERYAGLAFRHFLLQPMDGPDRAAHLAAALSYIERHPQWRLSLQTHKWIGLP
jgi:7-carboxy-7-deazaguanine synthase